jgi:hypothetical protein
MLSLQVLHFGLSLYPPIPKPILRLEQRKLQNAFIFIIVKTSTRIHYIFMPLLSTTTSNLCLKIN